jgi:MFS family permease
VPSASASTARWAGRPLRNGVGDHEQGLASGLVQASFQVGGAIGLAVVSAIVTSRAGGSTDSAVLLNAYRTALIVVAGIAAAGLAVALSGLVWQQQPALATADSRSGRSWTAGPSLPPCLVMTTARTAENPIPTCGWPYLEDAGWPRRGIGGETGSCAHAHTEGH